jgi:hypothetical protein
MADGRRSQADPAEAMELRTSFVKHERSVTSTPHAEPHSAIKSGQALDTALTLFDASDVCCCCSTSLERPRHRRCIQYGSYCGCLGHVTRRHLCVSLEGQWRVGHYKVHQNFTSTCFLATCPSFCGYVQTRPHHRLFRSFHCLRSAVPPIQMTMIPRFSSQNGRTRKNCLSSLEKAPLPRPQK